MCKFSTLCLIEIGCSILLCFDIAKHRVGVLIDYTLYCRSWKSGLVSFPWIQIMAYIGRGTNQCRLGSSSILYCELLVVLHGMQL